MSDKKAINKPSNATKGNFMRNQFSKWTTRDLTAVINDRYHTGKNGTDYAPVIEFIQSELFKRQSKLCNAEQIKLRKQETMQTLEQGLGYCPKCTISKPLNAQFWPSRDLSRLLSGQASGTCKECKKAIAKHYRELNNLPF